MSSNTTYIYEGLMAQYSKKVGTEYHLRPISPSNFSNRPDIIPNALQKLDLNLAIPRLPMHKVAGTPESCDSDD